MKKLLVYLKNYKKESLLAPLFKMLEAIFDLIVPIVVASIIDQGIREGNINVVISRSLILVALAVTGLAFALTAQYFSAKSATGFATELRHALFEKIQSFSFNEIDSIGTSTLITRITNDVNITQNGVNMMLRLVLRSPFIVIGSFVMAFAINPHISLIFLLIIFILSIIIFVIMRATVPMYKRVQGGLDDITLMTRENLSGVRVIRAFTEEQNEYNKFDEKNNLLAHFQRAVGRVSALLNPLTYVVINLGIIMLIYAGAIKVNSSTLTQGEVVALYNYMSQILIELIKFANIIVSISKAFASCDRISQILDIDNSLQKNNDGTVYNSHAVEFNNVSFSYNNAGRESLSNISFYADKGEVVGIIGSTGSGKSSLVNLIAHYYDATNGMVTINGRDVKSIDKNELRSDIGFVMQKSVLFSGTIRDNIKWGKADATDDEIIDALKTAQIYDAVCEKGGLGAEIEQNGSNLSGGQKQRLSIARAIVSKPEIIVLDDSASALDFATEKALREAILSLDYNPTLFIVSQRCSSILTADKIVVLDDGKCVAIGNNQELLNSCAVYKEIYSSQFSEEVISNG